MMKDSTMNMRVRRISAKHKRLISNYLCNIFDTMSDGIYITNKWGETIAVNSMYETLTGLEAKDLLGVNVKELVATGVFDIALNAQVVQGKKSATAVQVTGTGRKVLLTGHPIYDYDEDVELVVTYVRDTALITQLRDQISAQRQLIDKYKDEIHHKTEGLYLAPRSAAMVNLFNQAERVAKTDATILLLGETGVGKDVMAREIHDKSARAEEPFFKVDCTCIPENLIESELFGYAPGAFSGAGTKGKMGLFQMADRGTLFLDEIGELPLMMQGKLLRVLQEGVIQRVGATKAREIDVRIIAATNRNLEDEVKAGAFRSDLFYRLQVAVINIPPLRERDEDILAMIHFFIRQFNHRYKTQVRLAATTEEILLGYHWPGNIRELENLIHSLVVTSEDKLIQPKNLPSAMLEHAAYKNGAPSESVSLDNVAGKDLKEIMADLEGQILQKALEVHGSIPKVAKALNVDRTTVFRKIKRAEALKNGSQR